MVDSLTDSNLTVVKGETITSWGWSSNNTIKSKQSDTLIKKVVPTLSNVIVKGNRIQTIDSNGSKIAELGKNKKEIVGIGSDFFVIAEGKWIITYNIFCRKIKSMGARDKIVINASGSSFTMQDGKWLKLYDKDCNLLKTFSK